MENPPGAPWNHRCVCAITLISLSLPSGPYASTPGSKTEIVLQSEARPGLSRPVLRVCIHLGAPGTCPGAFSRSVVVLGPAPGPSAPHGLLHWPPCPSPLRPRGSRAASPGLELALHAGGSEPTRSTPRPMPKATCKAAGEGQLQGHVARGRRTWEARPESPRKITARDASASAAGGPGGLPSGKEGNRLFGRATSTSRLQRASGSFGDKQQGNLKYFSRGPSQLIKRTYRHENTLKGAKRRG